MAPRFFMPLVLASAAAAQVTYTPTNPDVGGAIQFGGAFELAPDGTIAGFGIFPGTDVLPAYWDATGSHALPLLQGDDLGLATGLNGLGQAVGTSTDVVDGGPLTFFYDHPVWWKHGVAFDLRDLVTGGDALELQTCVDIDDAERIVGSARIPGGGVGLRGYLFQDGVLTDLGDLNPGGFYATTEVGAIGADGTVVGSSTAPTTFQHAFAWKDGVMTDLHDFAQMPGRNSHALDVNAHGVISGSGDFVGDLLDYETGALFDHGKIVNLGSLAPGEYWAQAFGLGINDLNQVVGATNLSSGAPRAFLWQDGVMHDLNALIPPDSGWTLTSAEDVDNEGRIVGQGFFQGKLLPFLLEPDCGGGLTAYAAGCAGSGGVVPSLAGLGCPAPGAPVGLAVADGPPGAPGVLAFGLGQGSVPITPTCAGSIAPVTSILVPFALGGSGSKQLTFTVPKTLQPVTLSAQAAILDAGASFALSATNALSVQIQ